MTQPSAINQTFDTSLVDVQRSFSSTASNTSGSSAKENAPPTTEARRREPSPYKTVPTEELYAEWASTYDTDGNVLQAADDIQMHSLLPDFIDHVNQQLTVDRGTLLRILDLGCGTGRNTVKLLGVPWEAEIDIVGWDRSQDMLEIARRKCEAVLHDQGGNVGIELEQMDISSVEQVPGRFSSYFDGLISTLVLEHIPIESFFAVLAKVLKPGAYALVTNMHAEMGALSRAGFKTASGERFKATSYNYTVSETVEAAQLAGFEVIGNVREMTAEANMIDGGMVNGVMIEKGRVAERARKWVGTKVWYGMVLRKTQ